MDRISNLPDEILCKILSFLQIEEAALTSVLSKRWRNQFAFRQDLCLSEFRNPKHNRSFIDFVDRVLTVSGDFTVRKLSLKMRERVEPDYVSRWMVNVLSRGILVLKLDQLFEDVVTLPLEMFTCKTLVTLKLGSRIRIDVVPENAFLPALKTLFLECIIISDCAVEALVSACHVLEELTLIGHHYWDPKLSHTHTVSCPTLKRLVLLYNYYSEEGFIGPRTLSFDTPNLVYLDYCDFVANEYPVVNLDSLVEAKISLGLRKSQRKSNPKNLIEGLRNVEILNLSRQTSKIFYLFAESVPVFKNLSGLSMHVDFLPLLLNKSPNLETVVIKGAISYVGYDQESKPLIFKCLMKYSFPSLCPVKVLEITEFSATPADLEQMKYFMENLQFLELVKVWSTETYQSEHSYFTQELLSLPRPSKCKIMFEFIPPSPGKRKTGMMTNKGMLYSVL